MSTYIQRRPYFVKYFFPTLFYKAIKYPVFVEVLRDMRADTKRKRISVEELSFSCSGLAKKIQQSYKPDIVVAIATGGSMTGEMVAKILDISVVHIVIRRDINIGRMYNNDVKLLRLAMSFHHHYLFRTRKPKISSDINTDFINKKILIVDDTIHTGATIDVAMSFLKDQGSLEIRVASLAYISKRKPDFSILPMGNYCFPWSKDF